MFKFQNFERIILLILAFVILMKTSTAIKLPYNSEYKPRAYAESQAFLVGLYKEGSGGGEGGLIYGTIVTPVICISRKSNGIRQKNNALTAK